MRRVERERIAERNRLSGGPLNIPKTSAQRLALAIRLSRLKTDYLNRQASR